MKRSWCRRRPLTLLAQPSFRGYMGYGERSGLSAAKILHASHDLPIVVEIVDTEDKVNAFLAVLGKLLAEVLRRSKKSSCTIMAGTRRNRVARVQVLETSYDPQPTGLLDVHGNELFRVIEKRPIGLRGVLSPWPCGSTQPPRASRMASSGSWCEISAKALSAPGSTAP